MRKAKRQQKSANKSKSPNEQIIIPGRERVTVLPNGLGTVFAKVDHTDNEGTLGVFEYDPPEKQMRVRLNVAHPGIRSAALTDDEEKLNCYVAEVCYLGVATCVKQTGDYPWAHEEWPEYLEACNSLGREIRDLGKVQ